MYRDNPFGNPDGARADLNEIEYSFITDFPYGISFEKNKTGMLNKRVIIGAKGSGKTVYLRKMQSLLKKRAENNPSIFVDDSIEQNLNCTDRVIKFCELFGRRLLSEKWTQVWEMAILLTIATKFLYNPKLSEYLQEDVKQELVALLKRSTLLQKEDFDSKAEFPLYSFLQIILYEAETKNRINTVIENRCWMLLRKKLTSILRYSPELYFFLDAIDLEYEHAPLHWLMCQKGLFYAVLSFLQDSTWGEKLHLIITLRDNVFTSILRSEHSRKFFGENHIFLLNWNETNIFYFLKQKIEKLDDCYFISDFKETGKSIQSWLGVDTITNEFGKCEKIENFLIRHTRLVPRDVIVICNELAKLHAELVNDSTLNLEERIKDIILSNSRAIGEELLTICAKNITANSMPLGAGRHEYSDGFTSDQFYHTNTYSKLVEILPTVKTISFDYRQIKELEQTGIAFWGNASHLIDILWQNGVIGFVENDKSIFYAQNFNGDTLLPRKKAEYIIRSCVALKINLTYHA